MKPELAKKILAVIEAQSDASPRRWSSKWHTKHAWLLIESGSPSSTWSSSGRTRIRYGRPDSNSWMRFRDLNLLIGISRRAVDGEENTPRANKPVAGTFSMSNKLGLRIQRTVMTEDG
jgi:hypothetical protein